MVRYADDFILLCHSQQEAQEGLANVPRPRISKRSCERSSTGIKAQSQNSRSCAGTAKDFGTEFAGTAKPRPVSLLTKPTSEKCSRSCSRNEGHQGRQPLSRTICAIARIGLIVGTLFPDPTERPIRFRPWSPLRSDNHTAEAFHDAP